MAKQNPEFEIVIDGQPYLWRLQSQPQWPRDKTEWRGMSLAVRHIGGKREAILQFPPDRQPRYGAPMLKAERLDTHLVKAAITSALSAGWEPLSRGKTVVIMVDEAGG